ncbi:MAG: phosphotransferase, partial [Flavobacteriaceae bacterium]|nr:phosphotransferase [Flavobacteriaceae bacterium]
MESIRTSISETQAREILRSYYSLDGELSVLPGDSDLNFRVDQNGNPQYVLKISRDDSGYDNIRFQTELLDHLNNNSQIKCPKFVASSNGKVIEIFKDDVGKERLVRLLEWMPGRLWSEVNPLTDTLRLQLGRYCGQLTSALQDFNHSYA